MLTWQGSGNPAYISYYIIDIVHQAFLKNRQNNYKQQHGKGSGRGNALDEWQSHSTNTASQGPKNTSEMGMTSAVYKTPRLRMKNKLF